MKESKKNKNKGKTTKGYKEIKDPLTDKAPRHQEAALKKEFEKDTISEDVTIAPDAEQEEETVTLRFADSENFEDVIKKFESENQILLLLDSDFDAFIIDVPADKVKEFRQYMAENGVEEITETKETDERIAEVQSGRSGLAISMDESKTASKVGDKKIPDDLDDWARCPGKSDLQGVDTALEEPEKN